MSWTIPARGIACYCRWKEAGSNASVGVFLLELDEQLLDVDAAFEAIEETFDAVCIAVAQDRLLQRQPRPWRIGHKRLPAEPLGEGGNSLSLAGDVGDVVAGFLHHALLA